MPRPALIWGHLAARRRRSAASSVIYVGASSHVGPCLGGGVFGRRRRPRAAAPAGEDLPGPREGVRALRRSRLSGRSTPRRGRGARGRASSHGRGARLPSWSDREPRGLRDSGGRPRKSKMQQTRNDSASIWAYFAALCVEFVPCCCVLPGFGAVLLRSALIWGHSVPFCFDLGQFCSVLH